MLFLTDKFSIEVRAGASLLILGVNLLFFGYGGYIFVKTLRPYLAFVWAKKEVIISLVVSLTTDFVPCYVSALCMCAWLWPQLAMEESDEDPKDAEPVNEDEKRNEAERKETEREMAELKNLRKLERLFAPPNPVSVWYNIIVTWLI